MKADFAKSNNSGGIGFASLIGIVFIVLKLTGNIDWSWWWVLAPFWASFLFGVLLFLTIIIYLRWSDNR